MAGKKVEPIVTPEKIRDELVVIASKVKKGEITPNTGNAIANILRASLYAEQIRYQQKKGEVGITVETADIKLSRADRKRLDGIAKILQTEEG